jgi:hypothetical protein
MERVGFCRSPRQGRCSCLYIILLVFLFSCSKKEEIQLIPPVTSPLSRAEIGFGVVNVSYTHVVDQPDTLGLSRGYVRRGSVVRSLERRAGSRPETRDPWVLVEGRGDLRLDAPGWLPESAVDVYSTEAQARTAAESLLQ